MCSNTLWVPSVGGRVCGRAVLVDDICSYYESYHFHEAVISMRIPQQSNGIHPSIAWSTYVLFLISISLATEKLGGTSKKNRNP